MHTEVAYQNIFKIWHKYKNEFLFHICAKHSIVSYVYMQVAYQNIFKTWFIIVKINLYFIFVRNILFYYVSYQSYYNINCIKKRYF